MATLKKIIESAPRMRGSLPKKAKSGASFPDLNKDGKITKADVLKGRGVIAKKGATIKAKDGKWMQKATASIKRRGTAGVCTGAKFGGPTCKPGSKRYALAKTFKSIAKKKK